MPIYERISAVVSLTLIGLTLYFALDFPVEAAQFTLFNSPVGVNSPRQWLMIFLLGSLAMVGTDTVVRSHTSLPSQQSDYVATFCFLPGLLTILATQLLRLAPNPLAWVMGLLIVGMLLWATIIIELQQVPLDPTVAYGWRRPWQQLISYGLILAFYMLIYQTRSRSALSATGIALVSTMVAATLLRQKPSAISKTWLFAVIIGLSLGQITWALNYWHTTTLRAGLFLFLVFYVLLGLAQQQLLGRFSRQVLWEFSLVAAITLWVIFKL